MNYKLLVAEDVPAERTALCCMLKQYLGHTITLFQASDGAEALSLFYKEQPDIAILNIEMPHLSGLDVAKKIRESQKNCVLLFISDFDNFSYAKQAISLRALDYILKPYDPKKLILSVKEAMNDAARSSVKTWEKPDPNPGTEVLAEPESIRLSLVRNDICSYIEQHYMEELSMRNVAQAMNYSDAYFCKLFKQCFHVNFSTYLNKYRICKAKTLMDDPRASVKDIGIACGYPDPNYFSRVFKRVTGYTPTEYRLGIMENSLNIQQI